uniref:Uncharacterized protein n=1 Tax=Aplanochytrium stocchinoi TaxID=215587 RepID=A0A7S3LNY7_9STRA
MLLSQLRVNAATNATLLSSGGGGVQVSEFLWGNTAHADVCLSSLLFAGKPCDFIIGSDITYMRGSWDKLLSSVRYLMDNNNGVGTNKPPTAIFAFQERNTPVREFMEHCEKFEMSAFHCYSDRTNGVSVVQLDCRRS